MGATSRICADVPFLRIASTEREESYGLGRKFKSLSLINYKLADNGPKQASLVDFNPFITCS
jgi:hypothetical protein